MAGRRRQDRTPLSMLLLLLLLLLLGGNAEAAQWRTWLDRTNAAFGDALEWMEFHSGLGEQCRYVERPSHSVRSYLTQRLRAQESAVESVVEAIEAWEFARESPKQRRAPLVLAITGPTGTGKTETSYLLAESLFKRTRRLTNGDRTVASGLLVFRGEHFSDNVSNPITEYHTQISTRLAEHLYMCSGKAVVVFDEVQKVIPHTLDALMEAMSERAQLSFYRNGVTKTYDTSNVIFVLVSDIGVREMERVMMSYESREEVPRPTMENVVKAALDAQWRRLNFGKMIDKVVPFLPLEQPHIAEIIELKLDLLDHQNRGSKWHRLWVENGIADYMSRLASIPYEERSARVATARGEITVKKVYAKYGARNVDSGPMQLLQSKLLRYLRPYNPEAEIRVSIDRATREIAIVSCAPDDPTVKMADVLNAAKLSREPPPTGGDYVGVSCVTKWQGRFE
ncbi:hypothetical protein P43SY_008191 [Pythium insidiosum]|uniref:AAA+ ATPase domain-containing protein n=1 Tax=Pythium insidiosum TaxID=114742 RepID=A0AAD5Q9K9_PYTIN|nr:hypothetical protein P43SY_008191 [Pythium insidiosum]